MAVVGFLPLLGWLNWLVLPATALGVLLGMLSDKRAGAVLNLVVFIMAVVRLFLGGGIL